MFLLFQGHFRFLAVCKSYLFPRYSAGPGHGVGGDRYRCERLECFSPSEALKHLRILTLKAATTPGVLGVIFLVRGLHTPYGSMYGIFTYILTIHGSLGYCIYPFDFPRIT